MSMTVPAPHPTWTELMILSLGGLCLIALGALLGAYYCEYRRVTEVQQLTRITEQVTAIGEACVTSLTDVTRAAVIFARTQPRSVAILPTMRDSLRERRWTSP